MTGKRFHVGEFENGSWVLLDTPPAKWNALPKDSIQRTKHLLVEVRVGAISPAVAEIWINAICDKLNQFDISNAAVAKLT